MAARRRVVSAWFLSGCVAGAAVALVGCGETRSPMRIRPGPVVDASRETRTHEALQKVAVMPFHAEVPTGHSIGATESVTTDSAALVASYVSDALVQSGIAVITPSDLEMAFANSAQGVPRQQPLVAAQRASADFGATSVVLGRVTRWRQRVGSAAGATQPASVAFEVSLYEAPTGRRIWTGRFDETQKSITESVFRAREYPGGGTRWLSAEEFARWGAREVVKSLLGSP